MRKGDFEGRLIIFEIQRSVGREVFAINSLVIPQQHVSSQPGSGHIPAGEWRSHKTSVATSNENGLKNQHFRMMLLRVPVMTWCLSNPVAYSTAPRGSPSSSPSPPWLSYWTRPPRGGSTSTASRMTTAATCRTSPWISRRPLMWSWRPLQAPARAWTCWASWFSPPLWVSGSLSKINSLIQSRTGDSGAALFSCQSLLQSPRETLRTSTHWLSFPSKSHECIFQQRHWKSEIIYLHFPTNMEQRAGFLCFFFTPRAALGTPGLFLVCPPNRPGLSPEGSHHSQQPSPADLGWLHEKQQDFFFVF